MSDEQPIDKHLFLLGQIHGLVQNLKDGQDLTNQRLDKMDDRLRTVEQRSAAVGAVSGGAMAIGVALIVEGLKQWVGRGTPHP
jgi:hypothetical protein